MIRPVMLAGLAGIFLVAAVSIPGCGSTGGTSTEAGAAATQTATVATRGQYEAMTTGTPEEMARHLGVLETRFRSTDEMGPRQARAAMLACTEAQIATAEAILDHPDTRIEEAGAATQALLGNLARRSEDDPTSVDRLLASVDRVIEKFPKSQVGTFAAHFRVSYLNSAPPSVIPDGDVLADKLFDAAVALGRIEPRHPGTAGILGSLAPIAELASRPEQARVMYELLADRYKDSPESRAAAGHAHRLALVGQPSGPISGPSLDGTSRVSLDDLKGESGPR